MKIVNIVAQAIFTVTGEHYGAYYGAVLRKSFLNRSIET